MRVQEHLHASGSERLSARVFAGQLVLVPMNSIMVLVESRSASLSQSASFCVRRHAELELAKQFGSCCKLSSASAALVGLGPRSLHIAGLYAVHCDRA